MRQSSTDVFLSTSLINEVICEKIEQACGTRLSVTNSAIYKDPDPAPMKKSSSTPTGVCTVHIPLPYYLEWTSPSAQMRAVRSNQAGFKQIYHFGHLV